MNKKIKFAVTMLTMLMALSQIAKADYVGEVQTTKYLDPQTVNMIMARYQAGQGGLKVGDEISYFIEFTPTNNGGMVGGGGYVTDYLPSGVEVVNAQFVRHNADGSFSQIAPPGPAQVMAAYVPFYSETGIFFSTDPRTSRYTSPANATITATNGYHAPAINPARKCPTSAPAVSTHNVWDEKMCEAYAAAPQSALTYVATMGSSPVAGLDAYLTTDYSGGTGPWQRISYPGSYFGTLTGVAGNNGGFIGGVPTSAGWPLSSSNPLPAGTNAVRFAAGKVTVGELFSVRITLRITQAIPATGLINNTEVFGGDASLDPGSKAGKDTPWKYHFPNVANSDTTLTVVKRVVGMCTGAACVPQPFSGGAVPNLANLKLRYEVLYLNSSGGPQTGVVLSDVLPVGSTLVTGSEVVKSGPAILPTVANAGGFQFQTLASLGSGSGGVVQFDVNFAAVPGANKALSNTAKLVSLAVPGGVSSVATVTSTTTANLVMNNTTSTPTVAPGGTASYSLSVTNNGAAAASTLTITDYLPSAGGTTVGTRFSFQPTVAGTLCGVTAMTAAQVCGSMTSGGVTTPVVLTVASAVAVAPSPYAGQNREQVTFTPAVGFTLPVGASLTINFNAVVGSSIAASVTAYTNDAATTYGGGFATAPALSTAGANGMAPVTVSIPMSLTVGIDCVYAGATCVAYSVGTPIPTASKIRYRLSYSNTGTSAQTSVVLTSTLPTSTTYVPGSAAEVGTAYGIVPPTGTTALTFGTIASLAAGASGAVTFEVQLPSALVIPSGSYITDSAKVVSAGNPGGVTASVTAQVRDGARLSVTKTTSTPTLVKCSAVNVPAGCGTATYTITVTNNGNTAATNIKVYDELPYTGTVANALNRFNYVATTGIVGMTAVAPTTNTLAPFTPPLAAAGAPTLTGYTTNLNQQEIVWNFGAQPLAACTAAPCPSFTITYTAQAGPGVPAATYTNNAIVQSGLATAPSYTSALNAAPVTIPSSLSLATSIDCVYDAALTACNAYTDNGIIPVGATVRYKMHYANTGTSALAAVTLCAQLNSTQAAPALTATITAPAIAPTPTGPFANTTAPNGPPVVAPATTPVLTNPAVAACGFAATGVRFSYPAITSLAVGASGDVYFDAATNVTDGSTLSATTKIVNASESASSNKSHIAKNIPDLQITKSVTPTNAAPGATVSYTISIKNVGNAVTGCPVATPACSALKVFDFLPYSGTTADATKRFVYAASTGYADGAGAALVLAPVIATAVAPTQAPFSSNPNQQQVSWDFGAYALAPGATLKITFTATVGSNVPSGDYDNNARADFISLGGSGSVSTSFTDVTDRVKVGAAIDHIEIIHDGQGLTCSPSVVTVKVCSDAACTTTYGGSASVNLTPASGWTANPLTVTGGSTTVNFGLTAPQTVTLGAALTGGLSATNATKCFVGTTADCAFQFSDAGFIISATNNGTEAVIPAQTAGVSSGTYYLRAVKKASSTGACVAVTDLKGAAVPVQFAYECNDPTTCAGSNQLNVNGTPIAMNNNTGGIFGGYTYTAVNLDFGAAGNGYAPFAFDYGDVGKVTLHVKKAPVGTQPLLTGVSNMFAVKPHHFSVDVCSSATVGDCPANTVAATSASAVMAVAGTDAATQAGTAFKATVRARSATNGVTASYGASDCQANMLGTCTGTAETEMVTLTGACVVVAPATACVDGTGLAGSKAIKRSAFSAGSGVATVSDLTWAEVGLMTVSANAANFMAGAVTTTGTSANAGRFKPDHFDTSVTGPMTCTGLSFTPTCPAGGLAYSGQGFNVLVTAKNAAGVQAQNYQGAFAKAVSLSAVASNGGAAIATTAPGGMTASNFAATDFTNGTTPVAKSQVFTFATSLTVPADVFIRAIDTDVVSSLRAVAANSVEGGVKVVSGRVKVGNAMGSELLKLRQYATVEFYSGNSWVPSITDNATVLGLAASYTVMNPKTGTTSTSAASGGGAVVKGVLTITLNSPSSGGTGNATITPTAPAYLPVTSGQATFGVFIGRKEFIYLRESY